MSRHGLSRRIDDYLEPLETIRVTGDTTDLAVIDDLVSDARVVGPGEASHGVREFDGLFFVPEVGATDLLPSVRSLATRE